VTTIRLAADILREKEMLMRRLTAEFAGATQHHFDAGPVDEAYRRVHERWRESQCEIRTGLDSIADILSSIREAFEAVDRELAAGLSNGSGGGS
jgi:hypothetical protein